MPRKGDMSTICQRNALSFVNGPVDRESVGQNLIKRLGGNLLDTGRDVAVGVQRDADRGVAQAFLDYLGVNALLQHQAGVSMSERVKVYPLETYPTCNAPESV